jgi:hypothetical protein
LLGPKLGPISAPLSCSSSSSGGRFGIFHTDAPSEWRAGWALSHPASRWSATLTGSAERVVTGDRAVGQDRDVVVTARGV